MRGISLLSLIVSFPVLATASLSVFAQSSRYPTNIEINKLMPEFDRQIKSLQPILTKNLSEIDQLRGFRSAWSKINSDLAPFLGAYTSVEEGKSIYPSNTQGRVCIIDTFIKSVRENPAESYGILFTVGSVSDGTIRTSNNHVFIKKGDYLGDVSIRNDGLAGVHAYGLMGSLKSLNPTNLPWLNHLPDRVKQEIIQKFKEAGCTASLSNRQ